MHKNITTRQMKNFSNESFLNDLAQVDWKGIASQSDDIDLVVDQWTSVFSLVLEKHAPLINRRVRDKYCPWVTKDLRQMFIVRDRLKKQAIRSKSSMLREAYKQLRNRINRQNIELKKNYFTDKIASQKGDIKGAWKTINLVLNGKSKTTNITSLDIEGKQVCNNKNIAESLNHFYCNIGINLSKNIPITENPLLQNKYPINNQKACFNFRAIHTGHIENALGKLKTSAGFGADGIARQFVKIAFPIIAESLCDIFNLSLATSRFPNSWKIARVSPIFKGGTENDRTNYRPISVLPFLSRLFEKLVYNQLYDHLDTNNLIYAKQSGFRSLHSTVSCLLNFTNDSYINMDKGKLTGLIFIDLKKAFDTVDHEILLSKLQKYGINELEYDWFKSYLANRRQFCRVNGTSSNVEEINCGVPQGSCLGPLLFLIYINDLPYCLKTSDVTIYADDTTISYFSKSIGELNAMLNNDLHYLEEWLHGNKLTLNVLKTEAMIVGSRPNLKRITCNTSETPCFVIGDTNIDIVQSAKYLRIMVDQHLVWDEHITLLQTKISRSLSFLKYAKKFLPLKNFKSYL